MTRIYNKNMSIFICRGHSLSIILKNSTTLLLSARKVFSYQYKNHLRSKLVGVAKIEALTHSTQAPLLSFSRFESVALHLYRPENGNNIGPSVERISMHIFSKRIS